MFLVHALLAVWLLALLIKLPIAVWLLFLLVRRVWRAKKRSRAPTPLQLLVQMMARDRDSVFSRSAQASVAPEMVATPEVSEAPERRLSESTEDPFSRSLPHGADDGEAHGLVQSVLSPMGSATLIRDDLSPVQWEPKIRKCRKGSRIMWVPRVKSRPRRRVLLRGLPVGGVGLLLVVGIWRFAIDRLRPMVLVAQKWLAEKMVALGKVTGAKEIAEPEKTTESEKTAEP